MSTAERVIPVFTITRTSRRGGHFQTSLYMLTVSTVPGEPTGPYTPGALKQRLFQAALLDPATIRNLIQDAWCAGTASVAGVLAHTTAPMED